MAAGAAQKAGLRPRRIGAEREGRKPACGGHEMEEEAQEQEKDMESGGYPARTRYLRVAGIRKNKLE